MKNKIDRYNQLVKEEKYDEANKIHRQAMQEASEYIKKGVPVEEAMQKAGFIKSEEWQSIIDSAVRIEKDNNPYWPMARPFAELREENEALDEFLSCGEFEITGGLLVFHDDLHRYQFDKLFLKMGISEYDLLKIIHSIITIFQSNTSKPSFVRNKIKSMLDFLNTMPGSGQVIQILILQGLVLWFENCDINEGDKGYHEAESQANWIYQRLAEVCTFYFLHFNKDENSKPLDGYLATTEIGKVWGQLSCIVYSENPNEDGADNVVAAIGTVAESNEYKTDEFLNYFNGKCSQKFRDQLIMDIKTILLSNPNGRQITAIASVIYNSDKLHAATKPKTFNKWLDAFSKCWNVMKPTSKQSAVKKEIADAKSTFYYVAENFSAITR